MTAFRQDSEGIYRRVFEKTGEPILLLKDGRFTECNTAALKMLGNVCKTDLLGRSPAEISPACQPDGCLSGEKYEEMLSNALREGIHRFEWMHKRPDGSTFLVEVSATAVEADGEIVLHTLWRDITRRKHTELYEAFRSRVLEMLTGEVSLSKILEEIVRGVEQLQPAMLCSILLLDRNSLRLHKGAAPSLPDFYNAAIDGIAIGAGVGSCGTAAYTGERVVVEDIACHPYWAPYRELAVRAGLGACWSQPVFCSTGKVLGTFAIYHHAAHTPSEADLHLIEQTAHLASIAIERSVAAEKLRDSEAHYRLLTEDASDVIWKTDRDYRFTYISPADERLRGYPADEVLGRHVFELFTEEGVAVVKEVMKKRQQTEPHGILPGFVTFEVQHRCRDGSLIWGEVFSTPEFDEYGSITGYHGITREISRRKQMEEQVRQLAFYDALTQIPNRRLLYDRLKQTMAASKRSGRYSALMFMDLDNFKPLNDLHGHVAGDMLLIEAADRLKRAVRETDTVARFGGDEFVVVLSELDEDKSASILLARNVAEKVRAALSAPFLLNISQEGEPEITFEHRCTASIGVVVFINHEGSQDDILKWADATMYRAKQDGHDLIRFYEGDV